MSHFLSPACISCNHSRFPEKQALEGACEKFILSCFPFSHCAPSLLLRSSADLQNMIVRNKSFLVHRSKNKKSVTLHAYNSILYINSILIKPHEQKIYKHYFVKCINFHKRRMNKLFEIFICSITSSKKI